jgi:hypothetical protein
MKSIQMEIKGGLGNQLFQYSFVHFLLLRGISRKIQYVSLSSNQHGNDLEIEALIRNCPCQDENIPDKHGKLRTMEFSNVIDYFTSHFTNLRSKGAELHEKKQFLFRKNLVKSQFLKKQIIKGYFQNQNYVERCHNQVFDEISRVFGELELGNTELIKLSGSIIMHVRGGDYFDFMETIGMLSVDFYKRALLQLPLSSRNSLEVIVVTNDSKLAKNMVQELGINRYQIFDQTVMSAWETLYVMANARYFIASNSTLSWWGAYLAKKNGGLVFYPKPWFKDPSFSLKTLSQRNVQCIQSDFI